ncbi:MAG TPA: CNNM domain-containing protein, partial [Gemmatimonadaceae bacterium]|nr:CNNM domain-containing protein [Gemmatimonadaceae bacterium]
MVLLLVALNAFFVAAEFALVAVRRSRIDQLAAGGDSKAATVQEALTHLDRYISGTQLGITLASLALGWIGEPALAILVDRGAAALGVALPPGGAHLPASIITAFLIITFLHIVLGELAPKSVALVAPEKVSRWVARPLMLFSQVMSPFIWLLNGAANRLLMLFGMHTASESNHVHSPEELRLLVMQARAHGTLDESDSAMLAGVFDFHEKKARDVMRPRTEVAALDIEATEDEVWEVLRAERYSRYPVYRDSLDDVVGVFLAKDLWLHDGAEPFRLETFVREVLFVPDSRPAEMVLDDLRRTRAHMAVVLDEYGGTAGIVTMEDLVEEVIGDIADEYDLSSRLAMETDGVLELAGSLSLVDARSDYQLALPEGDWSTVGGYVFSKLGRLPHVGDRAPFAGGSWRWWRWMAAAWRRCACTAARRRSNPPEGRRLDPPSRRRDVPSRATPRERARREPHRLDPPLRARAAGHPFGRPGRPAREHLVHAH